MAEASAGNIKISFKVDTSTLSSGMNKAQNSIKKVDNATGETTKRLTLFQRITEKVNSSILGMGNNAKSAKDGMLSSFKDGESGMLSFKGVALAVGLAVGAALVAMAAKIAKAIDQFASMADEGEDIREYFGASYGALSSKELEFATAFTAKIKANQSDIEQFMAKMNLAFKSAGVSAEDAAARTESLVQMAYNIQASFAGAGMTLAEAKEITMSIAKGETDALSKLGLTVNDITLKNYALSKGIAQQGERMDAATKQAALYSYVMEKLGGNLKDYSADSKDYDTATQQMDDAMASMKETIGGLLLPVVLMTKVAITDLADTISAKIQDLREGIAKIEGAGEAIWNAIVVPLRSAVNAISSFFGFGEVWASQAQTIDEASEATADAVDTSLTNAQDAAEGTSAAIEKAMAGLAGFDKLTTLSATTSTADEVDTASDSLLDFSANVEGVNMSLDDLKAKSKESMANFLKFPDIAGDIKHSFASAWDSISSGANKAWNDVETVGENAWKGILSVATTVWTSITSFGETKWNDMLGYIRDKWNKYFGWLYTIDEENTTDMAGNMKGIFDGLVNTDLKTLFTSGFGSIGDGITDMFTAVGDRVKGIFNTVINFIKDGIDRATGMVQDILSGNWSGVSNRISQGSSDLIDTAKGVLGFANGGEFTPNDPQLVVMGDNKRYKEYALTEPTLMAMMETVAQRAASSQSRGGEREMQITIPVELNGRELARATYQYNQAEAKRRSGTIARG